jgi:hypothetical protein
MQVRKKKTKNKKKKNKKNPIRKRACKELGRRLQRSKEEIMQIRSNSSRKATKKRPKENGSRQEYG